MPFAEARTGTLRAPGTVSCGRTASTAREGGSTARGCLPDGWGAGGGGVGRRVGGALVRPRGREAMRLERAVVPAVLSALEASSLSRVCMWVSGVDEEIGQSSVPRSRA